MNQPEPISTFVTRCQALLADISKARQTGDWSALDAAERALAEVIRGKPVPAVERDYKAAQAGETG